jgi:hypothetical protein
LAKRLAFDGEACAWGRQNFGWRDNMKKLNLNGAGREKRSCGQQKN